MLPAQMLDTAIDYSGAEGGGIYRAQGGEFVSLSYGTCPTRPTSGARLLLRRDESGLFRSGLLRCRTPRRSACSHGMESAVPTTSYSSCCAMPTETPDLEELNALGAMLSLALENARLREDREVEIRQDNTLFRVSQAFMSTMELDPLLDLVVTSCVDTITNAENCVLHLLDSKGQRLIATRVYFADPSKRWRSKSSALRPGVGAAGLALSTGSVVNIPDATQDARFFPRATRARLAPCSPRR